MLNLLRIAFRNMNRQKKRSLLLGGAIAFGILIITLLNSFTAGLADNIKNNFSSSFGGHIYISGQELTDSGRTVNLIRDDSLLNEILKNPALEIEQVNKRSRAMGSLIFGSKEKITRIDGVDWQREKELENLELLEGSLENCSDARALILPASTAGKLGVQVGETLLARLSTVTGQQNVGEFVLAGIMYDQGSFGFSAAYANLEYLNSLLGLSPGQYQLFHIYLKNMETMEAAAKLIHRDLSLRAVTEPRGELTKSSGSGGPPGGMGRVLGALLLGSGGNGNGDESWEGTKYSLTTLNDLMEHAMSLVELINTIGLVVFILLLVITMVGITNTFRMIMLERTREIGTMRALGMQRGSVRNIFLSEALFVALGGALCGVAGAGIVMIIASAIPLEAISIFKLFLNEGHLSFRVIPGSMALNILIVGVLSLVAAWLPAKKASQVDPAQALRTQY